MFLEYSRFISVPADKDVLMRFVPAKEFPLTLSPLPVLLGRTGTRFLHVEEAPVRFLAEEQFAHRLEALCRATPMLAHRVHIAKVLLEPLLVANAGGPHDRMHEIDRLPCRLHGVAGGELHRNPLFGSYRGAGAEIGPSVVQRAVEIRAGSIDHRLGARHAVLDGGPIAEGHLRVVGDLASGEGETVLERGAGDPERHAGNGRPKEPEPKRIQRTAEG